MGYWTGRKEMILFDAVGSKKYNAYHYKVIDADTVQYTYLTEIKEPSCDGRYAYTDHRVHE
jgi:hypothetical protein